MIPRGAPNSPGPTPRLAGRLVPLRPSGLPGSLATVLEDGGIPLVGDDGWSAEQWARIRRLCADAVAQPGIGWASLTSGSGGFPRVVLRSADSWSASFPAVEELLGAREGDVVALPAPPASSLTLFSIAHSLEGGPRPAFPSGRTAASNDFASATLFHGTPHALRQLLDTGTPPRLRAALVGGSGLDAGLRARAEALGIRVVAYYGAAELSFVAVDHGEGYVPFPGVELDVRDGILWVRSPFVAAGHLEVSGPAGRAQDRPSAQDGAPRGPLRSANGWHTVDDRAELSTRGLRLLGRADGAVLTASATVVPEDVEAVLRSVDGVGDAVVLGLPHAALGDLLAAVIEPRQTGTPATAESMRRAARELLSPAHRPRRWFRARLPRTASGKPARAEVARMLAAGEVDTLA